MEQRPQLTYGEDGTVLNRSKTLTISGYKLVSSLTRPLPGLVLGLGMLLSGTSNLSAQAVDQVTSSSMLSISTTPALAVHSVDESTDLGQLYSEATPATPTAFPANGVYLYGQSPTVEQIGVAYAIMEIVDNRAVGAFYMPQSSFDCFYGAVEPNNLNLNVVSSYDQATHEYSVAFQGGTAIATTESTVTPVQLEGYHAIDTISNNDHRILGVCRTDLAEHL